MKAITVKPKFSDAEKTDLLRQIDAGASIKEICGAFNISPQALIEWRSKLAEIESWREKYKKKVARTA